MDCCDLFGSSKTGVFCVCLLAVIDTRRCPTCSTKCFAGGDYGRICNTRGFTIWAPYTHPKYSEIMAMKTSKEESFISRTLSSTQYRVFQDFLGFSLDVEVVQPCSGEGIACSVLGVSHGCFTGKSVISHKPSKHLTVLDIYLLSWASPV